MTFDKAVEFVLEREGGYVNDPTDAGGETNFGISARVYPNVVIKTLTRSDAIGIYKKDYWDFCNCDQLPPAVAFLVFDAAVNQGQQAAKMMLQKALGVRQDGIIGEETVKAAYRDVEMTVREFVARRMFQYGMIPQFTRFGLGWSRRLIDAYKLALEGM